MLLFHILTSIVTVVSGFLTHDGFPKMSLEVAINNMVHHITDSYFSTSPCVVLVTEKTEPLSGVKFLKIPTLHIMIGDAVGDILIYVEDSSTTDIYALGTGAQVFERLLIKTLDARCLGYFIQIQNSTAIVHSFGRAFARALQRVARSFVFFPSVKTKDMDIFAKDMLRMKGMDLMPNVLIAKIHTNVPVSVSLEEALSLRKLFCSDTSLVAQEGTPATEETLRQGTTFIENLSLSFKGNKNLDSVPKLESHSTKNMILAIELVTQSFVGLYPSNEVFLDIWMQFKLEGLFITCAELYPDKILDLQGRPLTAVSIPYDPFAIVYHYDDPPIYDGIEFLIFRELVYKCNGTMKVVYDPDNFWGTIFENGTGNGIVGNVLSGAADAGFAAVYLDWYYEWLWTDFSYPYGQSAAILVVPRPKLLPGFLVPLLPFSSRMWTAVLLSVLGISVCSWCLSVALHWLLPGFTKKVNSFGKTYLDTLAMLVLQVPNQALEEWNYSPWKHFMTWMFIYFLLITSIYSGGLASILTVPRFEHPIDTLAELAHSNVNWTFTHEAAIWAYRNSDDPVLKKLVTKFKRQTNEELAVTAMKGDTGICIEMLTGGAYGYGPYITTEAMAGLRLMKEPLYLSHVLLITRKDGPYTKPLNDLTLAINQGGLGIYWQADVVRRFLSSRLQLLITLSRSELDSDGNAPRTLQLSHVEGPFMLLAMGLGVSAVTFLAEIAVYAYQKKIRRKEYARM